MLVLVAGGVVVLLVIAAVTVLMTVSMSVMTVFMPMLMYSMVSLRTLYWISILIRQQVAALEEIIDHQRAPWS